MLAEDLGRELLQRAVLGLGERRVYLPPGIGEELERALGGDARVELAQRAGGGIAGIGEGRFSRRRLPFVDALDGSAREAFLADYTARITKAYPARYDGKVLLRFPRLFIVAVR